MKLSEVMAFSSGFLPRKHNLKGDNLKPYKLMKVRDLDHLPEGDWEKMDDDVMDVSEDLLEKYHLKKHRLIFVAKGRDSFPVICPSYSRGDVLISSHFILADMKKDMVQCDPRFMSAWLNSPSGQRLLASKSRGSALKALVISELNEVEFVLPELGEQHRLRKLYECNETLQLKNREYENKMQDLMDHAFQSKMRA